MAFLQKKTLLQNYAIPLAMKIEKSCKIYTTIRRSTSNSSTCQPSFLHEATNLLKESSNSTFNAKTSNSELNSEVNRNNLERQAPTSRIESNSKTSKKRKKNLFRNMLKPNKEFTVKTNNDIESKFIMHKPSLTFKAILEQNNIMADTFKQNDIEANKVFDKAAKFYESKREAELQFRKYTPEYAIDWNSAMAMIKETETQLPSMAPTKYELGQIPINNPTFNIAKIIHDLPTLQRLVDLGVDLSSWEKNDRDGQYMEIALRLNFEVDVKPRINWMLENGIEIDNQGDIFTETPEIFNKSLDELNKMVEYLKSKKFSNQSISDIIVNTEGSWLKHSVVEIDSNLGYFQKKFGLTGNQVRQLAIEGPKLIIWPGVPFQVNINHITIVDGMGFTHDESKELLIKCPELFQQKIELTLQSSFDMVHGTMGLSHEAILRNPIILTKKRLFLKSRHLFLRKLGRDQYDPKKPNYISPKILCDENDANFCEFGARVPVDLYNKFLMTI